MPNLDWKSVAIGAVIGYFAVPYVMNFVKSKG